MATTSTAPKATAAPAPKATAAPAPAAVGKNSSTLSTAAIQSAVGAKSDGIYGSQTTAAVKAFQSANGLVADGIVGPKTQAAITAKSGSSSSGGGSSSSAGGAYSTGGGSTTTTKPAASSVIVTSTASKNNFANNVSTLNTANNSIKTVQAGQTATGIAKSLGMTPEAFLKLNPSFAGKGGPGDYAGLSGKINVGQEYNTGGGDGSSAAVNDSNKKNPDGSITNAVDPNDGTTTTKNPDGTTTITTQDGVVLDPTMKKLFDDNIAQATRAVNEAEQVMEAAKATLEHDPAAIAAADNIVKQYNVLIQQMKDKNALLQGSYARNSARTGMMQYANEMDTNFKSMEFDKGIERIATLVDKENTAVSKSNAAYKANDIKALDAATKEYNAAIKDKTKSILDLNTALNKQVTQNRADIKAKQTEINQTTTNDIKLSTALAVSMADAIASSGIKDEKQIDAYIQAMAETNGISNPEVLRSALLKAQSTAHSLDLTNTRKVQVINKGKNPTNPKNPKNTTYKNFTNKPTASTITKVNTYLSSIGATKADMDKVNGDEASFYKVLNAIPKTKTNGS